MAKSFLFYLHNKLDFPELEQVLQVFKQLQFKCLVLLRCRVGLPHVVLVTKHLLLPYCFTLLLVGTAVQHGRATFGLQ